MGYCRIHGQYKGDGCSDCRDDAERASSDRQEILDELSELRGTQREVQEDLADAINNPGNYSCPHCKLRTLLKDASRCPRCHGKIVPSFWEVVRRHEETEQEEERKRNEEERKRELQRDKEQRQRNEEERQRSEAKRMEAKMEAEQDANDAKTRLNVLFFAMFYFGYLLPVLAWITTWVIARPSGLNSESVIWLIPAINWLGTLGLLFSSKDAHLLFPWFALWAVAGVIFATLLSGKKK